MRGLAVGLLAQMTDMQTLFVTPETGHIVDGDNRGYEDRGDEHFAGVVRAVRAGACTAFRGLLLVRDATAATSGAGRRRTVHIVLLSGLHRRR